MLGCEYKHCSQVSKATESRDQSRSAVEAAEHAVEAAGREVAGEN
jgi:hypothetical protein